MLGPLGTCRLALNGPPPLLQGRGDGYCSGHARVSLSIHDSWPICLSSSFSSAHAVGFIVVFLAALNVFVVSAFSFPLYNMVTTSGHRWFSPSPSCTEISFQVIPACLCPVLPARTACVGCFPSSCPPRASPTFPAITLRVILLLGCCKGVFSLLSLQLTYLLQYTPLPRPSVAASRFPPAPSAIPEVHCSNLSCVPAPAPKNTSRALKWLLLLMAFWLCYFPAQHMKSISHRQLFAPL